MSSVRVSLFLLCLLACVVPAFGQGRLAPGTRVEIDGIWNGEFIEAVKLVREGPADLVEVKGHPTEIRLDDRVVELGPFTIEVVPDADIDDKHDRGDSYRLDELQLDWHYQFEGELTDEGRFRAVEITVDRKKVKELVEIEAFVDSDESLEDGTRVITVLGVPCHITADTVIVGEIFMKSRRRVVDADDERPEEQFVAFERLILGGEIQIDYDYRDDFDLDKHRNRDRFVYDTSMNLEATLDLEEAGYMFAKARTSDGFVLFDEDDDLKLRGRTHIEELYFYWTPWSSLPVAFQIGRQDFDDTREWVFDENLDAIRIHLGNQTMNLEYSFSEILHDAERRFHDREHHILFFKHYSGEESYLGAYMVDIRDSSDADDSPFILGLRAVGEGTLLAEDDGRATRYMYWADFAYEDGVRGTSNIEAHGLDVGGGFMFPGVTLSPNFYAGYAFGSGDGRSGGRTDRQFHQSGYQDNNDRLFGVASFRYYGELMRPELSNLHVGTIGVGVKPTANTSVDVLYHHYRQDERAPTLINSKIRQSPSGMSRDIGEEIDLVFGLDKLMGHFDAEIDIGYFIPGSAFQQMDHPALYVAVQLEWSF